MRSIKHPGRRALVRSAAALGAAALAVSAGLTMASASAATAGARAAASFSFKLVPSPNIAACLPKAGGSATITPGTLNDTMKVSIHGMPASTGFDLFVIQQPRYREATGSGPPRRRPGRQARQRRDAPG